MKRCRHTNPAWSKRKGQNNNCELELGHPGPHKKDDTFWFAPHRCVYCGVGLTRKESTKDHVVPRSKGGKTSADNIVKSCGRCNRDKKDELLPIYANTCLNRLLVCYIMMNQNKWQVDTKLNLLRCLLEFTVLNPFTKHPNEVQMTYWQHFCFAVSLSWLMFKTACVSLTHAVFPFMFEKAASNTINALSAKLNRDLKRFKDGAGI